MLAHAVVPALAGIEAVPDGGDPSPVRVAIRIVLGVFIAVLFAYIVIEQVGSWRRRRGSRGTTR